MTKRHDRCRAHAPNAPRMLLLVAGEPSGDLIGAELIRALRLLLPGPACPRFIGAGGPAMRAEGLEPIVPMEELSVLGLWEVVRHYPRIRRAFDELVRAATGQRPDAAVLIDYPGFNLRLARQLRRRGIRVVYYVSPQVWAWGRARMQAMPRRVDLMLTIFPFERELYREIDLPVEYVGHPVLDRLAGERFIPVGQQLRRGHNVALLPGSREHEVRRIFPVMVDVARELTAQWQDGADGQLRFLVAVAHECLMPIVWQILAAQPDAQLRRRFRIEIGAAHRFMRAAAWGMVASGTATLESAYFGMPTLVLYKVAWPTYQIARRLVRVPHLAMVNLLAGRDLVAEFIQDRCAASAVAPAALELARDPGRRLELRRALREVIRNLGPPGAARRAAGGICRFLEWAPAADGECASGP